MSTYRKLAEMGLGLLDITEEKARKLADELISRGEAKNDRPGQLVNELLERGAKTRKILSKFIEAAVRNAVGSMGLASSKELQQLQQRIAELEKKLSSD